MKTLFLLPLLFAPMCWPSAASEHAPHRRGPHDWSVDNVHSSVVFRVKHAQASWFFGTFDKIEGSVTLDPEKPGAGSVELKIPVDSVDSNNEQRDGHLKSPDFFNAKANPRITFQSTKIERKDDMLHVTASGMAGKSKSITIPVEHVGDGEFRGKRRGYLTEFTVKRSDFGMTYGIDSVLGDEVTMTIALELVQAKMGVLELVLRGVLPPIVAALLLVSMLGMRALPLAAGLGLYGAHGLLKHAWPPWPHELWVETDGVAWLVWGVIATGVLAALERFEAAPRRLTAFGAPALAAAMIWLSLGKLIARWDAAEIALHAGSAVAIVAATSVATRRTLPRLGTSIWPAAIWTAALSMDALLATFGRSALLGQLCGAVAAALGAAVGARLWRRQAVLGPADAGWLAATHAGFVLVAVHLAYLDWGPAICALAAPFAALLLPRAAASGARTTLLAGALLLAPMAIALWSAWPAADPYGY